MEIDKITRVVIGSAMNVLNELRPGLDEKLYERALVIELKLQHIPVEQQKQFPVHYRKVYIGKLIPDLIVGGKVVVDTKVVSTFNEAHVAQMIGYLKITGLEVGLLLNFKKSQLEIKRVANQFRGEKLENVEELGRTADNAESADF